MPRRMFWRISLRSRELLRSVGLSRPEHYRLTGEETMPITLTGFKAYDIRFPTSRTLAGSDAMNPAPDYSAAYVILYTDSPHGFAGHGLTFTIGRGTEICVAAINALAPLIIGRSLKSLTADMAQFW